MLTDSCGWLPKYIFRLRNINPVFSWNWSLKFISRARNGHRSSNVNAEVHIPKEKWSIICFWGCLYLGKDAIESVVNHFIFPLRNGQLF